jgi:hypothetical protein
MKTNQVWREAGGAGAEAEAACATFLAQHTAYRDGQLTAQQARVHEAHGEHCASCARYARVVERGVAVLRGIEPVAATPEFAPRLQHRIFHLEDPAFAPRRRYLPVTLMAAALAAVVLVPRLGDPELEIGTGYGAHPHEAVFGRSTQLWEPAPLPLGQPSRAAAALPVALYSPVVVPAPQYRGGPDQAD